MIFHGKTLPGASRRASGGPKGPQETPQGPFRDPQGTPRGHPRLPETFPRGPLRASRQTSMIPRGLRRTRKALRHSPKGLQGVALDPDFLYFGAKIDTKLDNSRPESCTCKRQKDMFFFAGRAQQKEVKIAFCTESSRKSETLKMLIFFWFS